MPQLQEIDMKKIKNNRKPRSASTTKKKKPAKKKAATKKKAAPKKPATTKKKKTPAKARAPRDEFKEHRIYQASLPGGVKVQKRTKAKEGYTHMLFGKKKGSKDFQCIRMSSSLARLEADQRRLDGLGKFTAMDITNKVTVTDTPIEKPKKAKAEKAKKDDGYKTKKEAVAAAKKILGLTGDAATKAPKKKGDLWVLPKAS